MIDAFDLNKDLLATVSRLQGELSDVKREARCVIAALVASNGGELVITDKNKATYMRPSNDCRIETFKDARNRRTVIRLKERNE